MQSKINTIKELLKAKGYSFNCSWVVNTKNHRIQNGKLGGKMILDFDGKFLPHHLSEELLDDIISELK